MFFANKKYNTTEDMINKLRSLKGKTKLNFYQKINKYYDETTWRRQRFYFQFEEDLFAKTIHMIGKIFLEVLL